MPGVKWRFTKEQDKPAAFFQADVSGSDNQLIREAVSDAAECADGTRRDKHAFRAEGAAGEGCPDVTIVVAYVRESAHLINGKFRLLRDGTAGGRSDDQMRLNFRQRTQDLQRTDPINRAGSPGHGNDEAFHAAFGVLAKSTQSLHRTQVNRKQAIMGAFWDFSLRVYAVPGVAQACLELQNRCGADVNLLLLALYAASLDRRLDAGSFRMLDDAVRAWRADVVGPLRSVRRRLKAAPVGFNEEDAEAVRELAIRAELRAEQSEQSRLEALLPAGLLEPNAATPNIEAYATGCGLALDKNAVLRLVRAVGL